MPLHNDVYDDGLNALVTNVDELHILSADPGIATYGNIATMTLGNKAAPTIGAPANHTTGRKVTAAAITDGTVTGTDTATHFAWIDTINSKILATAALGANQVVTNGNTFTLTEHYVAIPAPV